MALGVERWAEFNGDCLRRGVAPLELPLHDLLDIVFSWGTDGAPEKERHKWIDELFLPPDDVDPDDADGWSDDELLAGFESALRTQRQQHAERSAAG